MRNVPLWVDIWRCLNIILGGAMIGLFTRYTLCLLRTPAPRYTVHYSIPLGLTALAVAIIVGTITNLHIGVGLTLAVPLCTLGEVAGIRGMLDLVALRKAPKPNKIDNSETL